MKLGAIDWRGASSAAGLRRQLDALSQGAPGDSAAAKRRAAIGSWSAMVGAMILARLSDDRTLSDEVLSQTRAWIEDRAAAAVSER